jgi:hypothetical protein
MVFGCLGILVFGVSCMVFGEGRYGDRRHLVGSRLFYAGEAFSLDRRGWKAAPTGKGPPAREDLPIASLSATDAPANRIGVAPVIPDNVRACKRRPTALDRQTARVFL